MTDPHASEKTADAQLLELNFVPDWARKPPGADPYRDHAAPPAASERRSRDQQEPSRHRRDNRGPRPPGGGRPPRSRPPQRENRGEKRQGHDPHRRHRSGPAHPPVRLPIQISFLPDQQKLATMAADIRAARHAFPLPELAHLFLTQPQWHAVRFEAHRQRGGTYAFSFYHSKLTELVYHDEAWAQRDVAAKALTRCFKAETIEKPAPIGNFVCVARCGLSGEWLGPPNHHDYTAAVQARHAQHYGHMSLDDYRRHIETVRDPAAIEAWKEAQREEMRYRLRTEWSGAAAAAETLSETAARTYIAAHILPRDISRVNKAVVPGPVSRTIQEPALLALLRAAWAREQRYPATLARALRGAFKRMKLHIFQTRNQSLFVTPIAPHPIDPGAGIRVIRELLQWLQRHPGGTRAQLIADLQPTAAGDPAKLAEWLQPLSWLIEKGHVIEFHNGTLAVPT